MKTTLNFPCKNHRLSYMVAKLSFNNQCIITKILESFFFLYERIIRDKNYQTSNIQFLMIFDGW